MESNAADIGFCLNANALDMMAHGSNQCAHLHGYILVQWTISCWTGRPLHNRNPRHVFCEQCGPCCLRIYGMNAAETDNQAQPLAYLLDIPEAVLERCCGASFLTVRRMARKFWERVEWTGRSMSLRQTAVSFLVPSSLTTTVMRQPTRARGGP
jgi:hypothetical protein